jgi:transcriptional regulator with XRE-family HTH domain
VNEQLSEFLNAALRERNWSQRELGRQADVSGALVSEVINGNVPASTRFCVSVARALGESPERLLRLAGYLPDLPDTSSHDEERAIHIFRQIPDAYRDLTLRVLATFADSPDVELPEMRPGELVVLRRWSGSSLMRAAEMLEGLSPEQIDRLIDLLAALKDNHNAEEKERKGVPAQLLDTG